MTLIICPNETKISILEKENKDDKLYDNKFITIEEFIKNYFFSYDYRAVLYLKHKYGYDIEIGKTYIESLYTIEIDKKYTEDKLIFLQNIKKELFENHLIEENKSFKKYLENKEIKVVNYPKLEKYLDDLFKSLNAQIINKERKEKKYTYHEFNDIDDEVEFVTQRICDLKRKGVSLNDIYLVGVSDEYFMQIRNIFRNYNININLKENVNLLSYDFVKEYFEKGIVPENDNPVKNEFLNKMNSISYIDDKDDFNEVLKSIIRNVDIPKDKYKESVNIGDVYDRDYDNSYVFILGFNYGTYPQTYKDDMFINDSIKEGLYSTTYKNEREERVLMDYLSNIDNLCITLKNSTYKNKYYKSLLIDKYGMEKEENEFRLDYSDKSNIRTFNKLLDNLYKYNVNDDRIKTLYSNYEPLINTYSHEYKKIDKDIFNKYINKISLSYTSMNSYNLCPFSYYIKYILKAEPFEVTFAAFIGDLFHYILEHSYAEDFDSDKYFDKYIENKELKDKERFFLSKLKRIIKDEVEIIKDNDSYTMFHERCFERNINILISKSNIELNFTGKIDKILYYKDLNKTYFSVIDYKTGSFDSNLYNMCYGLSSQLATYLYLIIKGKIFDNPIFTGIYFQDVLMSDKKEDSKKDYKDLLRDNLKYQGYSIEDKDIIDKFDNTYVDSKVIKGMKLAKNGNFSGYAKTLTEEDVNNLYNYTDNLINKTLENIVERNFEISPIKIGDKDKACTYCKFKDICYKKEEDYRLETEVKNLDFLGGDLSE